MKTIFVIRGFSSGTSAAAPDFAALRSMLGAKRYRVVPVPIHWDKLTSSNYVDRLIPFYNGHKSTHNTLLGGSLGALAAFIAAPILKPNALILCSLSPFFREDLPKYDPAKLGRRFGEKRTTDFANHSAAGIAAQIKSAAIPVTMFYGEQEKRLYPHLVARVKDTAAALGVDPIEIPGAGHRMREPEYIKGLKQAL